MSSFDGLVVGMNQLHRLSEAQTRSICAENVTGEKGKGGMAVKGSNACAGSGAGVEGVAVRERCGGADVYRGGYSGVGSDSAHLDDADGTLALLDPADLLGRSGAAVGGVPGRGFLRLRVAEVRAGVVAGGVRESGERVQLLLADAVSQALPDYADQHRPRRR